jgi:hypothetical protein
MPKSSISRNLFTTALVFAGLLSACGPRYSEPPTTPYAPYQGPDSLVIRVAQPPTVVTAAPAPRYPDALKREGRSGTVVIAYVTDSTGAIMPQTAAVLYSDNGAFTSAVCTVLHRQRLQPVTHGGRKRRALRIQAFEFKAEAGSALPKPEAESIWRKTPQRELMAAVVRYPRCGG